MANEQKYIAWGTGIVLWIFGLSIFLSYLNFGYLDLPTVKHMLRILSPLLIMAAVLLYLFKRPGDLKAKDERVAHVGQTVTVKP
ncbi:MAG: hypothetical protein HYV00_00035 [Deltaproteobacteria bacterium]|nr:hypothetical protein [Deltaproteobacteria bacterium]